MAQPTLHIVMPVLNEAAGITATLGQLQPLLARGARLVVADGGSSDGTRDLVHAFAARRSGVQWLDAPRGRARQMNAGAQVSVDAGGETPLLFLHADTALPSDADSLIATALADGRHHWGRFDVAIQGRHWLLPVIAFFMNRRSRASGIATGDQALFMTRAAFEAVRGFPDQPLMEDIEISARLKRLTPPACLRARARTSGRRWETHGVWRTVLLMWRLRLAYWRGVPAAQLAERYR
ncbi:MAG: TIGR04283 family arsenosugar biosynthesis glycosyltransferase [Hylemonella sp.]|nr:TIGR04283 family arsenosugar biosynthesis glycosyltransferase [Hylemonella sp.]